jgi:phage terminase large subunit
MKKRIRICQGGTSASKTFSIILVLIDLAMTDKSLTLTSIVSESFPHLRRGCLKDFLLIMKGLNIFEDKRWNSTNFVYNFPNGSKIEFFSVDQADKVRGARRDRLFINEANNVTFDAFEQLEVRTKEFIFIDYNPTIEFWVMTELEQRNDVEKIILTYKDNEALSPEIIASIEQRKNRKGWWKVYGEGQLGEIEGLIYKDWRVIDEIPHEARLERRWLDFGYTNDPSAIGEVYYYNGGWILNELLYRNGMSNKQLADFLNALDKPQTTIVADSAEPKSIDEIRSYGLVVVPCQKGKDSVVAGIQLVQDQPISVTRNSYNILKEQRNYMWWVDKNGKTLNQEDPGCANHHMSGIRYALETLGRIKQEVGYWDRIWEKELNPDSYRDNHPIDNSL